MRWNNHSTFEGCHAFLGASKYSWLNYDEAHLIQAYKNSYAKERGTRLHAIAASLISEGIKQRKTKDAFNMHVNDAIGYNMDPEVVLFYSRNCFGTADAISFNQDILRVHDYKSGTIPAKFEQLYIYDALFCLEYKQKPGNIKIENRIYQNTEIATECPRINIPDPNDISKIMERIIKFDRIIEKIREEEM